MGKRDLFNLDGKVALVTGGTSGIGLSMAQSLWEYGCELIITSLPNSFDLDEVVKFIKKTNEDLDLDSIDDGPQISFLEIDFLKIEIKDVEDEIVSKAMKLSSTGIIDILVANAGFANFYPLEEISDLKFDEVIHVNSNIPIKLIKILGKFWIKNLLKGKVIITSSIAGYVGIKNSANYSLSKASLISFAKSCAVEWSSKNIYVNCIAPGYVETSLTSGITEDKDTYNYLLSRHPIGRLGKPQDFKGVVVFLASDASDFVCGATIAVDGGWLSI